jgi:hypothetical protein
MKLERRHQDQLMARLEDARLNGCAHLTWNELYYWYDTQKIAARTYRDLETRWQELTNNDLGCLMRVDGRGGIFIFGESSPSKVDPDSTND